MQLFPPLPLAVLRYRAVCGTGTHGPLARLRNAPRSKCSAEPRTPFTAPGDRRAPCGRIPARPPPGWPARCWSEGIRTARHRKRRSLLNPMRRGHGGHPFDPPPPPDRATGSAERPASRAPAWIRCRAGRCRQDRTGAFRSFHRSEWRTWPRRRPCPEGPREPPRCASAARPAQEP